MDDPDKTPITEEFRARAYYYGKSLVPVSKTDEGIFKNEENKCLKAIGFTDSFRVPSNINITLYYRTAFPLWLRCCNS